MYKLYMQMFSTFIELEAQVAQAHNESYMWYNIT